MIKVTFAIQRDDGDYDIILTMNNSGERWGGENEFAQGIEEMKELLEVELEAKITLLHNVALDCDVYEFFKIKTKRCVVCGKDGEVSNPNCTKEDYNKWFIHGIFIQDAMPMLSDDEREQVLSGTHPKCFTELFGKDV